MPDERKRFECESLKKLAKAVFEKKGLSPEKSADVAEVMLAADSMGIESHGVQRISMYMTGMKIGRIKPKAEITVVKETPVSAVLDNNDGMGQPAAIKAMKMAIDKAKKVGIGMVTVRNSNHFGIGGYYSLMAAKQGLFGCCMTNSEAMVVPTFGRHPMLGTNPIAVSMPTSPTFFHFDISTSVVPAGKIEVYARNKKPLPEGWAVDPDGNVTTDPEMFLAIRKNKTDGGLLPLGGYGMLGSGHKGYAFSMIVELMTAVFSGGNTSNHVREIANVDKCCHMFQAIDYGIFGDKKEIEAHFSKYMNEIRESPKAAGQTRICCQGDIEAEIIKKLEAEGIPIHETALAEIIGICKECGVDHQTILEEKKKRTAPRDTVPEPERLRP
ncbi:MAG: Ldh family oxidoreductase [Planctomycetota bacterium]|jgi:LDH2 family malate/lactate/ureidoglycolate dehydrogenase|nr:Ldh family oxidoreductase [Planctomycetota bacterium]